jgi:translocation and assembly module TamA
MPEGQALRFAFFDARWWVFVAGRLSRYVRTRLQSSGESWNPIRKRYRVANMKMAGVSQRQSMPRSSVARLSRLALACVLVLLIDQAHALQLEVRLVGLDDHQEWKENVLALLGIYQEREDEKLTQARMRALHRQAPDQIRDALAPFGLYRVEVSGELAVPSGAGDAWVASYRVVPGDPVRIGAVDYRITGAGAEDPAFPSSFPMDPGDVLLHADYEKARDQIRSIASKQGFLDAELVQHQVLIDTASYEALIIFHLDTGPRYYLGDVRFDQGLLDEELLRKYVSFEPGSVYDPEKLLELQARLLGTEYYGKVEIVPLIDEAGDDNVVPIEVVAEPKKANKYRLGLGYGTDTGMRSTIEWRRRYLTRWGHNFRLELFLSQPIQSLSWDYRIPVGDPMRDYIKIRPDITYYDLDTKKGDVYTVQFAYSVVTKRGWRRTAGLDYRYEDYEISEYDADQVNALEPNISWSKTVTDDPIYTTDGYRLKYTLLGSVQGVVSDASYLSGIFRLKWIRSFAEDYRFITRAHLGATWADSLEDLPSTRRFFTGGDDSIRGWGYDVLGPNDPETNIAVGGRYLAVGSLELERRIKGDWSGALFTDFGNAFDPDFEKEVEVGAGVGVRWRSPIGQIRMDVAFALTKEGSPARLHVVIGPDL